MLVARVLHHKKYLNDLHIKMTKKHASKNKNLLFSINFLFNLL